MASEIRTQERLVGTSTTGNNSDHTTNAALDDLLGTRWELDSGLALVWVVSDNSNVVTRGSSKRTTVTHLLFDVGDNGTLWAGTERKNVSDVQAGVLSGVDELTSVHSLVGDESLGVSLVSVWVAELDAGEWRTTTWVVNDLLHDSTEVSMALSEVEDSELSWVLVEAGVGCEDRATTLSLITDDTPHDWKRRISWLLLLCSRGRRKRASLWKKNR